LEKKEKKCARSLSKKILYKYVTNIDIRKKKKKREILSFLNFDKKKL